MKDGKYDKRIMTITEYVYLAVFFVITVYLFLITTVFPTPWAGLDGAAEYFYEYETKIPLHMEYLLWGIILVRCFLLKKEGWKHLLISIGLYMMIAHAVSVNGYKNLLLILLLMLGAKGISFFKMMKLYTITVGFLLGITILSALSGVVDNMAFYGWRYAFGIVSPTDFGAHVFFVILCIWYVRGEKSRLWESVPVLGAGVLIYYFNRARCSTICLTLLAMIMCGHKLIRDYKIKKNGTYRMNAVFAAGLSNSHYLGAIVVLAATMAYDRKSVFMQRLNVLLSNRLELGNRAISIGGFDFWGRRVRLIGNWVEEAGAKYFYLDSSYMQMAVMYGIAVSVLLLTALLVIGYRAFMNKQWILLWVLFLMSIHGMIEQRLWSLSYCPFLLALFARLDDREEGGKT